ncbi:hypothetical protein OG239_44350 (plasmid) [Streptomyces sp. NBC_00868]|uniref:hypothetical protein n=1 Tax=unclassified Streptomyces TaxID=2593676 RepID=UPI003253F4F8|nr:hypothetical protein OG239_44350 [Streptomyces sp. NBC_00868]
MYRGFIRRPKRLAAVTGLAIAVGLAVVPAQADSRPSYESPVSTGTTGQGAAPGGPVTRDQVIARARHWVEKTVPYSQSHWWKDDATGGRYRQDCSGFVSMAWQLKDSLTTQSLPDVADKLAGFSELEAGDALDYPAAHALLFGGWTDKAKGDFVYYSESRGGRPALKESANIHDSRIAGHPRTVYVPLRYKKLVTTPAPAPAATAPSGTASPAVPVPPGPTGKPTAPDATAPAPAAKAPAAAASETGTSFAATDDQLYAVSPNHSAVYEYTGKAGTWTRVRGTTGRIYTSGSTLYATDLGNGDIHQYDRARKTWTRIGGPGAEFAATNGRLYGISPDRSAVYEYTGKAGRWIRIGGPADRIYAAGGTLYATGPRGGSIHQYDGTKKTWTVIGGPGAEFAVAGDRLYGISPDHQGLYEYTGKAGTWTKVRGATGHIYTKGSTLYATDGAGAAAIHQYDRSRKTWTAIGGPGADFAATRDRLYGASPDHSGVWEYTGRPGVWIRIGSPVAP